MIFASVAVNINSAKNRLFTYKFSAEQLLKIKVGSIVEVEFKNKLQYGIVMKLIKFPNVDLIKLKNIKRIINIDLELSDNQILLARFIADYYGTNIGKVLFHFLPPIRKTGIKFE